MSATRSSSPKRSQAASGRFAGRTASCRGQDLRPFDDIEDARRGAQGQDPRAILNHAIAYGCPSSSWHAEDRNATDENRELAVAGAISGVRLRL
jgi:hypothetical protein